MATSFGNSSFGPRAKKIVASPARLKLRPAAKKPERAAHIASRQRRPGAAQSSASLEHQPAAKMAHAPPASAHGASLRPTGAPLRQILPTKCGLRRLHKCGLRRLHELRPTREEDHGQLPRASSSGPRRRGPCAASNEWRKYQFSQPPTRGLRSMLFGFDIHVYGLHQRKFSASASILQITKPVCWASG